MMEGVLRNLRDPVRNGHLRQLSAGIKCMHTERRKSGRQVQRGQAVAVIERANADLPDIFGQAEPGLLAPACDLDQFKVPALIEGAHSNHLKRFRKRNLLKILAPGKHAAEILDPVRNHKGTADCLRCVLDVIEDLLILVKEHIVSDMEDRVAV